MAGSFGISRVGASSTVGVLVRAQRGSLRPVSWPWLLAGVVAVGLAAWSSTWWLLSQTQGLDGAAGTTARLEAIKIGLSVGVAAGGAVALLLAMRRQWLSERDQLHREQVAQLTQAHAERVAASTEYDANERRVTELFANAAGQLGSDKAPVRMAGLYALERLAQDHPGHRQTIVDLVCAYLRLPYTEPQAPGIPSGTSREEATKIRRRWEDGHRTDEHHVRRTAETMLVSPLKPGHAAAPDARFWDGIRLNLQGAFLIAPDFSGCRITDAEFSASTFRAGAAFDNATFEDDARFGGVTIRGGASFAGATFRGRFFFGASVGWYADFRDATFASRTSFRDATTPAPRADQDFSELGFPPPGFDLTGARTRAHGNSAVWPAGWTTDNKTSDGWSRLVRDASPTTTG